MNAIEHLIGFRNSIPKPFRRFITFLIQLYGADIPQTTQIGRNVRFPHNATGTVLHPNVVIKENCVIYQNVTIGRSDVEKPFTGDFELVIEEGCIVGAGAKILAAQGKPLHVGKKSMIGANAVLLCSTGDNEVWAGVPARKVGMRNQGN
ncbi:serine O-acetyltransferase [uncultured Slackia sp.]|uniref:serine O-acetyltransferase n=1 Tax=uncultured Slackia sp. TaxID=665903 RepID=UPI0025FFE8C0|nr:hypothetical protein [uncultured Slackia sp.]